MEDTKPILRRRHGAALKAQVLAECDQPGASVASVALNHGLNANLVHRWRRLAQGATDEAVGSVRVEPPAFMPLQLPPPPPVMVDVPTQPAPDICIELHRGTTSVKVTWPMAAAADCATWLRELLR
jgi:transposase